MSRRKSIKNFDESKTSQNKNVFFSTFLSPIFSKENIGYFFKNTLFSCNMFLIFYPNTWVNQKFGNISVWANLKCLYHVTEAVQSVKSTCCGWCAGFIHDLKLQRWMCQVVKFRDLSFISSNRVITWWTQPKNFVVQTIKGTVDHSTITRWVDKFCLSHENLNNQAKIERPKTIYWGLWSKS